MMYTDHRPHPLCGLKGGRCVQDAEWEDRYLQMTTVDEQGYLYILGGVHFERRIIPYHDVWRSTISFHDLPAVARLCGITIPSCGPGLRCWPGPGTVQATDGSFVSCAACPHPSLSYSSPTQLLSASAVAAIVVLVTFGVAASAYSLLLKRRLRAFGGAGHSGDGLWISSEAMSSLPLNTKSSISEQPLLLGAL